MKRILQLDFFRGLFLVLMTAHHFISPTNILFRLTNESIGWITAAEGFFFLSGFTAGIVYGRLYTTKGQQALLIATKKRMLTIYLHFLMVALLITACVYRFEYLNSYWGPEMPKLFADQKSAFLLTPVLLYLPTLFDILPSYLLFFTLLPFAIRSFYSGKAPLVLSLSILIYGFGFFYIANHSDYLSFRSNHMPLLFNPFCWQLLFLTGIFAGYLFFTGKLQTQTRKSFPFILAATVSVFFFILKKTNAGLGINMAYWTDKNSLGPLRILNFASLTMCMGYFCHWFKAWFTFKPLCFLGRYSLEVFSFHILVIYFLRPVLPQLNRIWSIPLGITSRIYPIETILLIPVLLSLFLAPYLFLKRRFSKAGFRTRFNQFSFIKR